MPGAVDPIRVRRHGIEGPLVAVLHGGPGAAGSVASLARDLASLCRVLEPLQRRSGPVPLTVSRHVADLAAILPEPAILVGWSWGAMLGLSFAVAHPDRVRSLILVGCGTYDVAARAAYHDAMAERLGPAGRARQAELQRRLEQAADVATRDRVGAALGKLASRAQAFEPLAEDGEVQFDATGHQETWRDVLRLQDNAVEPQAFAAITCPVLMLHGRDDPHPGPAIRDSLLPYLTHLEYEELSRCGHAPWLERWGRKAFLRSLSERIAATTW
jgi:pimeloyl-ACP methyl ester carboxylesterase